MSAKFSQRAVLIASLTFIVLGLFLIPYAGLQEDEALFLSPFYLPQNRDFCISIFHHQIPLMHISYLGTLKSLVYLPLIRLLPQSIFLVRLPMVLAGAAAIFLLFRFVERLADTRTALAAAALLATDPAFLLTNTFDWGPVALEHLLAVAACVALVQRRAVLGCFLLGLALWNKSLFLWTLAGLVAAAVLVYPRELRSLAIRKRTVACAGLAFLLGALPLLIYNVRRPNATLRTSAGLSLANIPVKLIVFRRTLDGSVLFGDLVSDESGRQPRAAGPLTGKAAAAVQDYLGDHPQNLSFYALIAALLMTPVWWRSYRRRRAGLFAIVCGTVSYAAMLLTKDAGGSAHHVVLLWPMPQILLAVALASIQPRWLAAGSAAALVVANLLVVNQYLAQFARNGAAGAFTDAISQLPRALEEFRQSKIYVIDWGMYHNLAAMTEGHWLVESTVGALIPEHPDISQQADIDAMVADRNAVFLGHVPPREEFRGVERHLTNAASAKGYEKALLRTVADTNRRPVFEVFRLQMRGSAGPTEPAGTSALPRLAHQADVQ